MTSEATGARRRAGGAIPGRADHLDGIISQWSRERPDLDAWPMGVIGRVKRLTSLLNRAHEAVWEQYGLDQGLFDVLAALRRAGSPYRLSPTELYDSLLISSGTVTHRLARLGAEGLIERVPNPADGRGMLVQLTDRGRHTIDLALEAFLAQAGATLATLTASDREQVTRILRQLLLAMGDTDGTGAGPAA